MLNQVRDAFQTVYGDLTNVRMYFSPGRINLIGEHTDYNGGYVLPCALALGTWAAVRPIDDQVIRFYSVNMPDAGVVTCRLGDWKPLRDDSWAAYLKGVMWAFEGKGMKMDRGLEIVIGGNLPVGAGLSSSASIEVLTGMILRDHFQFDVSDQEIALIGQYSENNYNGVGCGIMDQFAIAKGKRDTAIFLNAGTLDYEYVPLELGNRKLVVTNTNKKHSLAETAFNDRRRECGEALCQIQQLMNADERAGVKSLCDITMGQWGKYGPLLDDPIIRKRARHVIEENDRTAAAVKDLKAGDIDSFGKKMNASHVSLRDDYEVSCKELDVLAETAWKIPGVIGSRMTGGGFGGCTVSIVEEDAVSRYCDTIQKAFCRETGGECSFYIVETGEKGGQINGSF